MILVLRSESITQFEINWTSERSISGYIHTCLVSREPANFLSTDNVSVVIPYKILNSSIIETYEKDGDNC